MRSAIAQLKGRKHAYVGTSGWSYKGWEKTFYPKSVAVARHFQFYATQFATVEINLTFYRLPTPKTVKGWREKAPDGFIYALKGSRFITHMKKLRNLNGALANYFNRIKPLKDKTGVVLWQLPPFLKQDLERLEAFLRLLPSSHFHAIEFRHPSWMEPETFALLRKYRAAHVSVSSLAMPMNLTVTSDIVYLRFHGLEGGAAHDYTLPELEPWAEHIRNQARSGKKVFAYFNNDANVRAPANAKVMMKLVGEEAQKAFLEAA
jgi:uncharacterized protein YecE (DUF72 family)